jgi:hypothetical protein
MLLDATPDRLATNAGPHSHDQLKGLWDASLKRDAALQTLAIELWPPANEHAVNLASAIQRSLNRTGWLLNCVLMPAYASYDFGEAVKEAQAAHAEALDLVDALGAELRRR